MLDRFSLRAITTATALIAVVVLAGGFAFDSKGFFGNLLAEVVGVLGSVLLAILIVERVIERERAKRWDLVADETIATLRSAVIRASHRVYLLLPPPRDPNADPYTLGLLQQNQLTAALRQLAQQIRRHPSLAIEDKVSTDLQPQLELIRGSVMPQLLAIGKHDLVARLAAVESAFQDLLHTTWLAHQFGHLRQAPEKVADLVDALAGVSEAIDEPK